LLSKCRMCVHDEVSSCRARARRCVLAAALSAKSDKPLCSVVETSSLLHAHWVPYLGIIVLCIVLQGRRQKKRSGKDRDRVMGQRERRLSYRQIGNSVLGGSTTPVIVVAVLMSTSNTTSWVAASVQRQTAFLAIWNATSLSSDWPGLEFERIHHLLFKTAK
jgi:hypothetical protein